MPWLIGTAFLHSVMVQEKKGMLKVWNMVLIILTYMMCVYGTFLTRSGIVNSVHAFAQSNIGGYFLAFITVGLSGSLYLLFDRLSYLKSENEMESMVSRESSFMFNNLLLLAACFAVLWGTMLPILSEAVNGTKMTVGQPFFNKVTVPIAIFLMFLTGVGPLLAWRKASVNSLKRNFLLPAGFSFAIGVALYFMGVTHVYALMALVMSAFVGLTIIREFYKGARARSYGSAENFIEAVVNLTLANTRRYGGYIVHFAFVLLFIGWSGQAFTTDTGAIEAGIGETIQLRQYTLRVDDLTSEDTPNYITDKAVLSLYEHGEKVAVMYPERRTYKASGQPTSEISIRSTLKEDLYVVFASPNRDGSKAIIQVYLNPLVAWVWIGGVVLGLGTLIAMLPNKRSVPRRQPVPERAEESKQLEEIKST
jgi:cytochrome c-type biogenesis protein CcmF